MLAAPPAIFFAGFVVWSRSPAAFFELIRIGQASFLGDYSVQYQSGPPHRPLFDLFVLAPVVCFFAAGALVLIASRRRRAHGGERWLALFLVIALAAFMGLPKNLRFVVILDPVLRLLAAWTLVTHLLEPRALRPRWLGVAALANAVPELWLFHATFIARKTYDPTTYDILRAQSAVPGPLAQPAPSSWPAVFFAATALAVAGLLLARRAHMTTPKGNDERSSSVPPAPEPQGDASTELPGGEPPRAAAPEATTASSAPIAKPGRERAITIGIAVACVVAALLVGQMLGNRGPQAGSGLAATAGSQAADPAADEVSAGLAATDPNEAVAHFRKALEITPAHYGATFQMARALDRAGRREDAQAQWERVLKMAEQAGDQPLADAARARLGRAAGAGAGAAQGGDTMTLGLEALYNKKDPGTAVARFREVLAQNPEHYGATFQLATALDQVGDPRAARAVWEKMAKMAEAISDAKTAEAARARLVEIDKLPGMKPEADPDAVAMNLGLDALYTKHDPEAAVVQFRKVLARNEGHYGATFQLATALDQAKKPAEARPHWERMLKMADAVQDTKTVDAARARLSKKP